MKPLPLVLILIIVTFINDCNTEIQGLKSIKTTPPTPELEICKTKKCIKKCCPEDSFVLYRKRKCEKVNGTSLNITLPVYDSDIALTSKSFEDHFHLIPRAFENVKFRISVFEATMFGFNAYLTESGTVLLELPNAYQRWTPQTTDRYCVDYQFVPQLDNTTTPAIGVWAVFDQDDAMVEGNRFFTTGMTISCVFLVLVLVVYSLLPELRNLGGMVLMAYVVSLLFAFIFLMIVQRGEHPTEGCIGLTLMVYFFFLASFCWMNIMSFDIWWTFRGYAKARPIHRRGEKCKFATYCLYAWGLPSAMTVALGVLNHVDLKHLPWLITPKIPDKGCFLEGGEKLVYLYAPMLLMIILNWLFFLMTAFNIWRLSRGTAVLDSAAAGNPASHRKQRHRLLVYLKLSILMGLNWILEVASSFKHELKIWYVTDGYNLLVGLAIFLIFVCKKKILRKLMKVVCPSRAPTRTSFVKSRSNSSVTETSNISQDTPTYMINNDPKGPIINPSFRELNLHIQSLKI